MFDDNSKDENYAEQPQDKIEPTVTSVPEDSPEDNAQQQESVPPVADQPSPEQNQEAEEDNPEVTNDVSAVASSKAKGIAITVIIAIAFVMLLKNVYSNLQDAEESEEVDTEQVTMPKQITTPTSLQSGDLRDQGNIALPQVSEVEAPSSAPETPNEGAESEPALPTIPSLDNTQAAEGPAPNQQGQTTPSLPTVNSNSPAPLDGSQLPPLPGAGSGGGMPTTPDVAAEPSLIGDSDPKIRAEKKKRRDTKRRSSIVLIGGTAPKSAEQIQQSQDFVKRGNSDYLLAKGKVVDAILETAINTNFGGEVRAVVSRDVYSNSGRIILIPKGSRVFGTYTNTVDQTYGKIEITWSRIDLASGYSVNISAPAVDHLGRPGIVGRLDNKQMDKIGQAVMASALNVVLAGVVDKLVKPPENLTGSNKTNETINTIRTISNAVAYDNNISDPQQKMLNICSQLRSSLTDKTSSSYQQLDTKCNEAQSNTGWQDPNQKDQLFQSFILGLSSITDNVTQAAATAQIASKQQDAAKQGFEEVSQVIKDTLPAEQNYQPVITVDQGRAIKIYINKDYNFPKKAVKKSRVVR